MLSAALLLTGCATPLPQVTDKTTSHAWGQPEQTWLASRLAVIAMPPVPAGASALRLLASGHEAFIARTMLAENARHTLDLQYHLVEDDDTAQLLLWRALNAAERGVRVRVLVDDIGTALPQAELAALEHHPLIEVRLFNPFRARGTLWRFLEWMGNSKRLNRRMHNKLWIADNAAGVIGGRNLADEYFDKTPEEGFADLDLFVAGPVVREASRSFDGLWNSDWAVPLPAVLAAPRGAEQIEAVIAALRARAETFRDSGYARTARDSEFRQQWREGRLDLIAADARVVADEPPPTDSDDDAPAAAQQQHQQQAATPRPVFAAMREVVAGAQRELLLVTPYLVPSESAMELLCSLAARGVVVRTLTNSLASTDVLAVHPGYARYRPRLLACGVQLFEMHPGSDEPPARRRRLSSGASLHAKALVVDREQVFMGSMNFDPRSRQTNTEIALHATSALLGGRLGALFDEAVAPDQAWRVHLRRPGDAAAPLRWEGVERGVAVVHTTEPEASRLRRLTSVLLGALLDEELL